ncbi:MAG: hypothetical protein ACSLFK_05645 [Gemmatimonadaceae bacterium]
MSRGAPALGVALVAGAIFLACVDIPTGADDLLSFSIDPLGSPSVVVGDTLRDSAGVATPLSVSAFNYIGEEVENVEARFRALDARVTVDSVAGWVVGDSASTTSSRVLAAVDGFTGFITIPVVLRPDTILGVNASDTLSYSLTDSTANVSDPMGVRVLHGLTTTDSAVRSYRVSFDIAGPQTPELARLVNDAGRPSSIDTTDASGQATRRIRVDVSRLVSLTDSVIVSATVKYRGEHVRGSPLRLVLYLRPQ